MANTSIPWAPSPNIFSVEQNRNGAIILHLVFMAYMSYTGAAVCYYFFLPAIDIITKKVIQKGIYNLTQINNIMTPFSFLFNLIYLSF